MYEMLDPGIADWKLERGYFRRIIVSLETRSQDFLGKLTDKCMFWWMFNKCKSSDAFCKSVFVGDCKDLLRFAGFV